MEALSIDLLDSYWNDILGLVRRLVQQQTFDTWYLPLEPVPGSDAYRVSVPNHFFLDWFSEHHLPTLNDAASQVFGRSISIKLEVRHDAVDEEDELFRPQYEPATTATRDTPRGGTPAAADPNEAAARANLNPDYVFESFVVSGGTDLAYAAATAVANQPGTHYNPLFIHGGVGLGKTHLMHAIGNAIARRQSAARICYLTAEKFMNELILSIQQGKTPEFKLKYRSMDVLLVDDVSFLAGKESTQDEFFHTFNALHDHKKQIVLTSDRSPKEITTLEERLRSRFEWGLLADIQPPNLETRIAILQRKVENNKIVIPDEVIEYIAIHVTDNIRKLEGALIRLLAFSSLMRKEISQELASEALSSYFAGHSAGPVKIADIIEVVGDHFEFSVDQLKSKRRTQDLARARQVAMHLARDMTGASLNQIGRTLGGRDHSTVAHACNLISNMSRQDPQFRGLLKDLSERIRDHARG
ncbi:MAG: chromosomal replication initiator protein DnaA [Candidatus Krumholzibacteria bacterium]|nr:chromosomal replication initiator protein DnaA [Candidatus Krumholzibacteria bacterium]